MNGDTIMETALSLLRAKESMEKSFNFVPGVMKRAAAKNPINRIEIFKLQKEIIALKAVDGSARAHAAGDLLRTVVSRPKAPGCKACGNRLRPEARFCPRCGAKAGAN